MKTSIRTHEGRVALVTGAAQGIGQALALALAERGAEVIVTDLTLPRETVNKIGPTGHAFQRDVTQEEDWHSLSVKSRDVGDVDIVVNNAGYFPNRSINDLDLPTWRKISRSRSVSPNSLPFGRPGNNRNEPLHRFKDGNYWFHERFSE